MTTVAPAGLLRALVVDDEAPAREELAYLLGNDRRVGDVRCASSGAEALRLLAAEPVDVVFCDLKMPGLQGMELARVLARFAVRPRIVFVTAYDEHAVEAFELQATDYVMKPVRAGRLALCRGSGRLRPPAHGDGQPSRARPDVRAGGALGRGRLRPDPPEHAGIAPPHRRGACRRRAMQRAARPGRAARQSPAHP